ncbi:uncharacterized protein FIBRA_02346 [Fibroporia radiculosa]|uniref:Carotenoid oxygenase n=1 Tax=Fibroporia radiculosa TaxID=599839 RepID=J4I904_9APHY|nr:uncharacterized protein FIBRA_02346 [Fibroporia radiculosa]CCM00316.1 predicted protein [Fibroporia radiculosa]
MSSSAAGFENATEQREPVDLQIYGEIPPWLSGVLYRTGPGTTRIPTTADPSNSVDIHHWFDGLAMHHRFEIHSGGQRVTYRSHHGAEDLEKTIADAGVYVGGSFGQKDPCQTIFRKFFSVWNALGPSNSSDQPKLSPSQKNVSVTLTPNMPGWDSMDVPLPTVSSGPQYVVAKTDGNALQLLDPETLEPLAMATYQDIDPRLDGPLSAAHSCRDPVTGDFYNFVCKFGGKFAAYKVFRISGKDNKVDILADINDAPPAYIHSFAMTEKFVVLCVWQSYIKYYGLSVVMNGNLAESIDTNWDPHADSVFYVVDRKHGGIVAKYKTPPFYCFHHLNAFDDPATGDVIIDMSIYPDNSIIQLTYLSTLRDLTAHNTPILGIARRFRLPSPTSSVDGVCDAIVDYTYPLEQNIELPVVSPSVYHRPYRYAYGIHKGNTPDHPTLADAIVKLDMASGKVDGSTTKVWQTVDRTPSEPIFVPRPDAAPEDEDDGVLLSVVLDEQASRSSLVVLDAKELKEIGRAEMTGVFPFGFHGLFLHSGLIVPHFDTPGYETNGWSSILSFISHAELFAMRMNFDRVRSRVPVPAKLRLFWERITLSRITTFYFLFSVIHFTIQLVLQIQAFVINAQAASFLTELVTEGNASMSGFTVYQGDLVMCQSAPSSMSANSCEVVWMGSYTNSTSDLMLGSSSNMTTMTSSASSSSASSLTTSSATSSASSSSSLTSTTPTFTSSSSSTVLSTSSTPITTATTSHTTTSTAPTETQSHNATSTHFVTVTLHVTKTEATDIVRITTDTGDDKSAQPTGVVSRHVRRGGPSVQPVQMDGQTSVKVNGLSGTSEVTLDHTCLSVLNWPVSQLDFTKREDISYIMFQFWVLAMSLVALLNESVPHIIASLLAHVGATAWGVFQIYNSAEFHTDFNKLTTQGACGVNLLPTYWKERSNAEIPSMALNAVALIVSVILSWRLIKLFGWQTFKRVGASRRINRVYTIVLFLSIVIQLTLFLIALSCGLWIDQLMNGTIGHLTQYSAIFKGVDIVLLIFLIPWLTVGWISVRREQKIAMLVFLFVSLLYLGAWGGMFAAATFRWTFVQWRFFSIIVSATVVLSLTTFIMGIVCRVNFGKGLSHYLNAREPLTDDYNNFLPTAIDSKCGEDVEKAEFPSSELPIPTYAAALSPTASISSASIAPAQLGPRFYNISGGPFELQQDASFSDAASSRTAATDTNSLKRNPSNISNTSSTQSKRWVIE